MIWSLRDVGVNMGSTNKLLLGLPESCYGVHEQDVTTWSTCYMLTWWSMRNVLLGHEQIVPESTSEVLVFNVNIRLRASGVNNNMYFRNLLARRV